uniref:glycoside hydrolase family 11 protein n=1 Tax=uncultured Cytophaga sp. TaxID=160238 RepID=UPI002632D679
MIQTLLSRYSISLRMFIVFSLLLFIASQAFSQTVTQNTQSTNNGYFYSFWNDGQRGSASMTLGADGNYSTTWSNINNFTAGKGWAVGKPDRVVCYTGSFNGGSNGFLALYGWTKNALIEYYVCENHGQWTPPGNTGGIQQKGTYTSDGGTYTIYVAQRTNAPSIEGNSSTFKQYWSVRTQTRSSGTITFANHVAAWKAAGMVMGSTWDYQIMESEGYQSSGSSNITISECPTNSCKTVAPTVPSAIVNYDLNATATQLTATGTALKWYMAETGGTALSNAPTPSTSTVSTTVYYVGQTLNGCEGPRASVTVNVVNKYKIFKVATPIVIDGTPESPWSNASVLPAAATKLIAGAVSNSADLSGNFKALWDDTYLYVLADVTDEKLMNESTNVYDDDAVEVYVDINNDKASTYGANDVQYSFGWNDGTTVGSLPSGRSVSGIAYSAVARTGGYIVEARIPWSTLQGNPVIGQLVGMDFMINDDDDGGTRDGKLSWNAGADDAWEDPSLFGTAVLQGLLPCTTPPTPTVTASVSYCQNATATALTASGTSLLWYTASTGGTGSSTAPVPATNATGTKNYFVSQNSNGCESNRAQIAVTVSAAPATPTVTATVSYCQNATATALTASGTGLLWYTSSTGGIGSSTAPVPATSATGIKNYFVSQSTTGCESNRAQISVTVTAAPSTPTVTATVSYCQNATPTALTASGTDLLWYTASTGGTGSSTAPVPATSATGTKNYFVSQSTTGCESNRAQISVTVNAAPAMPTVTASVSYCQNATATALTASGTSLLWYTASTGGTGSSTAPVPATSAIGIKNYFVSQSTTGCESNRAQIAVTVNAAPATPTVIATVSYCQNATATALTASGTGLLWYTASTGGTGSSTAPVPTTSATGATNYFVSQSTTGCESNRAQIAVTVSAAPATPTVTAAVSYCQNA